MVVCWPGQPRFQDSAEVTPRMSAYVPTFSQFVLPPGRLPMLV